MTSVGRIKVDIGRRDFDTVFAHSPRCEIKSERSCERGDGATHVVGKMQGNAGYSVFEVFFARALDEVCEDGLVRRMQTAPKH